MEKLAARFYNRTINLDDSFVNALKRLLASECKMMNTHLGKSSNWYWGRSTITNLALTTGIQFEFGSKDDMPADQIDRFVVVSQTGYLDEENT